MYGLPVSFDASVFVGKELQEICFTANTVYLWFEKDLSITILGSFIYSPFSNEESTKETVPVKSSNLMQLIGKGVLMANAHTDGTLTLHFEDQGALAILDDSPVYESYTITVGANEVHV